MFKFGTKNIKDTFVFPAAGAAPGIPGFDLLIFIGSIGAISIIIVKLKISKRKK